MRLHRRVLTLGIAVLLVSGTSACSPEPIVVIPSVSESAGVVPLVVGTPTVPDGGSALEGSLLANVYAAALNAAGVKAVVSPVDANDPTSLSKLEQGGVDVLPGYSSLLLHAAVPSGPPDTVDAASTSGVLSALKKALPESVSMLDAASAQDNDGLAVTAVTAEKYQLKTIEDLAKVCEKLVFGGSSAFRVSAYGVPALGSSYNCVPKGYEELGTSKNELLLALIRDEVQVADIHSSSPEISNNALVVLNDTKTIFPVQSVVPLVYSKKVPADVEGVLNKVSAALDNDGLINLNRLAAGNNYGTVAEAANAWLVQKGLLKANS